jgi:hypothetical protein
MSNLNDRTDPTPKHLQWTIVTGLIHAAVLIACAAFFLRVAPGYFQTFKELDLALPGATLMTWKLTLWVGDYWYLLVGVLIADVLLLFLRFFVSRSLANWLGVLILVAMMGITGLAYVSLQIPLQQLAEKLQ